MLDKKSFIGAVCVVGAIGFPDLAAAATTWEGQYLVSNVTDPCKTQGSDIKGKTGNMVFRPIINGGDPAEALAVVGVAATSMSLYTSSAAGGFLRGNVPYQGQRLNSSAKYDEFSSFGRFQVSPSTITNDTPLVTVEGTINKWFNHPGCNVTFKVFMQPSN